MNFTTPLRAGELASALLEQIHRRSRTPVRFMEFCGGHTVAMFRLGIRKLLPTTIELVSGPGCPVCVTAHADIDKAVALARLPDVTVTTFGDLFKVPGSSASLADARADGADVRVVYSPLDALAVAAANPSRKIVFLGVGFETTAPAVAASILHADQRGLNNYLVYSMHKVCPPALRALADSGEIRLHGLLCPGHVSAVTGSRAWFPFAREYGLPCVVAGFEPVDILHAILMLVEQVEAGISQVEIAYRRGVTQEGNRHAQATLESVFEPCPAPWRGLGTIADSGLRPNRRFARFDAIENLEFRAEPTVEPAGCRCGEVLCGLVTPPECRLFGTGCTPEAAAGPCMVSSEGSCATWYQWGRDEQEG